MTGSDEIVFPPPEDAHPSLNLSPMDAHQAAARIGITRPGATLPHSRGGCCAGMLSFRPPKMCTKWGPIHDIQGPDWSGEYFKLRCFT